MKLESRYNRIAIISSAFVLVLAAAGYFFLLRFILLEQLDNDLRAEKLVGLIVLITLGLTLLLGFSLFLVNRYLLKSLWRPFHATLSAMKRFDLTAPAPI